MRNVLVYFIIIATVVGIIIGSLTNHLAIRMLFHPYKAWNIGPFHVPFTPGLIPKRKEEIANRLGRIVEDYLFTVEGMKDFIEKTKLKERLYSNIMKFLDEYKMKDRKLEDEISTLFKQDWQNELKNLKDIKLEELLNDEKIKEKTIDEILSKQTLNNIDRKTEDLSRYIIKILEEYIASIEGKRKIKSIIGQLTNKGGALGFLTGLFIDVDQISEKTLLYLEQLLVQEDTLKYINSFIQDFWVKAKTEPLEVWFDKFDDLIKGEADNLFNRGLDGLINIPTNKVILKLEQSNYIEKVFNFLIELLIEKLNQVFSYLSISTVVETEVNNFSTELFEKMILEISGRELKMITYFGGLLGGLIGLFQGILNTFM